MAKEEMMKDKILIAIPTHKAKRYCQSRFFKHLLDGTKNMDFVDYAVVDNSETDSNLKDIGKIFNRAHLGARKQGLFLRHDVWHYDPRWRLASSFNILRDFTIRYGYSHMLIVESDVFPENFNFIKTWMEYPVIAGVYTIKGVRIPPTEENERRNQNEGFNALWWKRMQVMRGKLYTNYIEYKDMEGEGNRIWEAKIEVGGFGTGLCMIHRDALMQCYFMAGHGAPDTYLKGMFETAGVRTYIDPTVKIVHDPRLWQPSLKGDVEFALKTFKYAGEKFSNLSKVLNEKGEVESDGKKE